ncbi:hypothetical protein BDA96_01G249800 [Sorghum bicolor]|uniref:Uncharacterized protein n=2 Tax=Sorghum bicolor TaxID=4558 RepID=A0A1Z5S712_SORBI|nr:uncharacterized protein LOC8059304 [Sorghum bicolor]KAG0549369.1 hypothetical protein BDA96_01G249800 [Sorghum bicolor]OQU91707.1 hypothetical protein SORBI_3001G235100 [Sorghum bicolor]OQU91708.1 hypothetical protein SORBI_3001G235100 [Sorghum bicolor]|eukprot:XP_002467161.2 uncharacterized protein LOC8059304 [Sorghum bicolor]
MEQQAIEIYRQPLEEPELFWAPIEQAEQGLYGFLGDLQLSVASGSPRGLQIENSGARVEDGVLILQLLEEPQDEANLNDWLSGDLHPSPLLDTNAHYQTKCRRSGRRGTRKRRTSPWNPMFFESRVSREYTSRKNNSRWTAKEVEILVQGVSKFGVGRWVMLKRQFFKTSIRTSVNLKDKWRNLLKAYQGNSQKTTQLYLEPSLVEQIRKVAEKHPYPNKRHK